MALATSACDKNTAAVVGLQPAAEPASTVTTVSSIAISVDAAGYHPDSVQAPAGTLTRLMFTRTTDAGCGHQLVFPALGIRKDLPLNQEVQVDVTMPASGSVAFTCGMNMLRGVVVAQ